MIGYIYLIENKINHKKYIGQTTRNIDIRFKEHIEKSKQNNPKLIIHKAMKKYGINNFTINIIEEVQDIKLLDEREIYWIKFYDTYGHNGYNSTLGGSGKLINIIDKQLIDKLYRQGKSSSMIHEITGYSLHAIHDEIMGKKLNKKVRNSKQSYPVSMLDINTKQEIKSFISLTDAAVWLQEKKLTTSVNRSNILANIRRSIANESRNAYGFKWTKK